MLRKSFILMALLLWLNISGRGTTDSLSITITIAPGVGNANEQVPVTYSVTRPFPNPFNPSTRFTIALPQTSDVQIKVYNLRGQRVAELANGEFSAGYHTITWQSDRAPSGVYLIRVQSEFGVRLTKVLLLK